MNPQRTNQKRSAPRHPLRKPATYSLKRPPKRRNNTGAFFAFVFVMLFVYSVGFFVQRTNLPTIPLMRVEMGAILQPTGFGGLILRDEVVYTSQSSGTLVFHAQNHERVRAGSVVATVQDSVAVAALQPTLAQVDQDALETQRTRGNLAINQQEVMRRNHNIITQVTNTVFELSSGGLDGVFALGDRVRLGLDSRNELYFSGEPAMVELNAARAQVLGSLSHAMDEVTVSHSGILAVSVDGYETVGSTENLINITRKIIANASAITANINYEVARGDDIFRVVRSNDWYIAAHLPADYVINSGLVAGVATTLYVRTPTGLLPLDVHVYQLNARNFVAGGDIEYFVVFRTNREIMRFIDMRHVTFQLTASPQEGLKIPRNAIIERGRFSVPDDFVFMQDGVNAVLLRVGGTTRIEPVLGMRSADSATFYILADTAVIRVGDEIVSATDSFTLDEIETVTGVFVTNMGVAEFRFISLEGMLDENADYVILNPAQNPGLRLFDRIAADARNVTDHQILN